MSTVFLIMCDYLWKIVSKTAFISLCTRNLKPSCLVSSNFHVFVSFSPPHCIRQIPKFFKQTNKMAKRWHLSRLYCCVISILYPLCLFQTLHPVNNENKVRGLWGVIIFHLGDSGGAALHLSHPFMTVHYLPPTVMSTRLSLSVGDGTSEIKAKNKCYISLSTYNKRKKYSRAGVMSWAERVTCGNIVFWKSIKIPQKREGSRVQMNLMIHITSTTQEACGFIYINNKHTRVHTHTHTVTNY